MNQEKQRIKIAEACGWSSPNHPNTQVLVANWWSKDRNVWWIHPDGKTLVMTSSVPDYLNDLNAMHEAESHLRNGDWTRYCQYLAEHGGGTVRFASVHASAQARAIAFLKTLNLWEEETK